MFKNSNHYKGRGNQEAEKLGWTVINYILKIYPIFPKKGMYSSR